MSADERGPVEYEQAAVSAGRQEGNQPESDATTWALRFGRALTWLVYAFVLLVLMILALGFFMLLFGASPTAEFTQWVYRALARVMAPFRGIFEAIPLNGDSVLDMSVLFAMIIYGIVGLLLHSLLDWIGRQLGAAQRNPS